MSWQAWPALPQICHWYWNVIGAEPFHVPGFAVTVDPVDMLPLIDGRLLFVGAAADRDSTADATPTAMAATSTAITAARMPMLLRVLLSFRDIRKTSLDSDLVFWHSRPRPTGRVRGRILTARVRTLSRSLITARFLQIRRFLTAA